MPDVGGRVRGEIAGGSGETPGSSRAPCGGVVGSGARDLVDHLAPEPRLPRQIALDAGEPAGLPLGEQRRPLPGVVGEEGGQVAGQGVPTTDPQLGLQARVFAAEVTGHGAQPVGLQMRVDDVEDGPREPVDGERVVGSSRERRGRATREQRDERGRRHEPHSRTDTVGPRTELRPRLGAH
ncbi:hypothetical protein GCM10025883_41350 [Mobilicoccus caccae]|uniref:Uncharacterized protein n=1 Tax=Mobilicoccus caccae TaxID=1859295 RepID=A0ABQ6IXR9_9MICO|nr:hypothetical protein GCM10025883_41350 [Mobilicoccus caccae]